MAEKRMITKTIVDSDAFLDMPVSAQNLYFHLNIRADDEGFLNGPNKVMRMVGCNKNDLDVLLAKKFVLGFESGIIVIKHWKLHNCIRKDRMKETVHTKERTMITEKENGSYTLKELQSSYDCQTNDRQATDKSLLSIDKVSIDKVSIDKYSITNANGTTLTLDEGEIFRLTEKYPNIDLDHYCFIIDDYCKTKNKNYVSLNKTIYSWVNNDIGRKKDYKKISKIKTTGPQVLMDPDYIAEMEGN